MNDKPKLIARCPACGVLNAREGEGAFSTYSCKNCGYFEMSSITHKKPPLRDALIEFLRGYGARIYCVKGHYEPDSYGILCADNERIWLDDIEYEVNRDE